MKHKTLLYLFIAFIVSSCSTAYKAGQTPDDLYYSPTKAVAAKEETKEDKEDKQDKYETYTSSQDDDYIRMKIRNRNRWQTIDDYEYWNDSRYNSYTYNYYHNNWYNPYIWNSWNSPYVSVGYNNHCCCYTPYNNIKTGYTQYPVKLSPNTTRPNLNSYNNKSYNTQNKEGFGKTLKRVFTPTDYNNDNGGKTSNSSGRTYSPSSSSGSGKSSSGSVSRPGRN